MLREGGAKALSAAVAQTRPLIDVLWTRAFEAEPLDDPDRRAGFRKRLRALTARIEDGDVRAEYKAEFDRRLAEAFGAPRTVSGLWRRDGGARMSAPASAALKRARSGARAHPTARQLLLAAIAYPEIAEDEAETLAELPFGPLDSLRDGVLDALFSGEAVREGGLAGALARRGFSATLKTLEIERGPMRAALGGKDAATTARTEAWRALAASYMERVTSAERIEDERARTSQVLGSEDSERMKRYFAEIRRTRKRR